MPLLLAAALVLHAGRADACSCSNGFAVHLPRNEVPHPAALPLLLFGEEDPFLRTPDGTEVRLRPAWEFRPFGLCSWRRATFPLPAPARGGEYVLLPGVRDAEDTVDLSERAVAFLVSSREPRRAHVELTLSATDMDWRDPYPNGYVVEGTASCEDPRLVGHWLSGGVHVVLTSEVFVPLILRVRWEDAQLGTLEDYGLMSSGPVDPEIETVSRAGAAAYFTGGDRPCVEVQILDLTAAIVLADTFCVGPGETHERTHEATVLLAEVERDPSVGCACHLGRRRSSPIGAVLFAAITGWAAVRRRRLRR
jgi:hypothetical protein